MTVSIRKVFIEILILWSLLIMLLQLVSNRDYDHLNHHRTSDLIGVKYLLKKPPAHKMDRVDQMSPSYPSNYIVSLRESYRKSLHSQRTKQQHITGDASAEMKEAASFQDRSEMILGALIDSLLEIITKPKLLCRKLISVGGNSCRKLTEGAKNICFDLEVTPVSNSCLIYSFGIGYDFTFDAAMVNYGCEVFSFDSDKGHKGYSAHPMPDLSFYKIRLGHAYYILMVEGKDGIDKIVYRPLHQIMNNLNHSNFTLDVLKIDIESSEWKILEESIFKTNILEKTKQLSLELHLESFNSDGNLTNETFLAEEFRKYYKILKGLEERGFHLAHYEPNYFSPKVVEIKGRKFHIYCETLWINPKFKDHKLEDIFGNFYEDYEYPPKDLIEYNKKYQRLKKQTETENLTFVL